MMAEGLDGVFKDFANNKSFDEPAEWYKHLASTGRRKIRGHVKCRICSTVLENWEGTGNIDDITGLANIVCDDCKQHIAAEVAG